MRFQVYIPDSVKGSDQDKFRKVGIEHLAPESESVTCTGPDGKAGRCYAWITPQQARIGYKPKEQTWIKAAKDGDAETGRYWVGIWNDSPPTEEDLRRPDHRRGVFVPMGNDERWLVTTPDKLDRYVNLKPDGTIDWCVDEKFNWLVTDLEKLRAQCVVEHGDGETDNVTLLFDDQREFRFLCRLMAINYRITPEVCAHLRLFTQRSIRTMVANLLGLTLQES